MKILLISANYLKAPYPVYPIGLDYVAQALSPAHEVRVVDVHGVDGSGWSGPDGLGEQIQGFGPEIVGLSLRNADNTDITGPAGFVAPYRDLVQKIQGISDARIVLGGSGFAIFPREMLAFTRADYGIIGEGERIRGLVDALQEGNDPGGLPGVICREEVNPAPPEPWPHSFERRFDPDAPHLRYYLKKGGMLNLQSKRGCPFRCVYCTYPYLEGRGMRRIDPEKAAQTAIELERAGAKYLFITDSAFNADYEHSAAVAAAFQKAGLSIPWGGFFTPTAPPEDYYPKLADAGLTHVEFGTESLSDQVLSAYRKPFQRAQVFGAHKSAVDAGLHTAHYLLLGGPGEDGETLSETLSHVDKLPKTVLFVFCGMRIYPHTALYEIAVREGQISPVENLLTPVFYRPPGIEPEAVIERVRRWAQGHPNRVIGGGGEETAGILDTMYERGYTGPLWEHLIR